MQYVIDERNNTIDRIITDTAKLKSSGQINLSKKDINNLYKVESKRIFGPKNLLLYLK